MHLATPVVWRNNEWFELHHSTHLGHPYHAGEWVEVYPTLPELATNEDKANDLAEDLVNLQIWGAPVTIDPNSPGSPLHPRSIELGTPTRPQPITDICNHNIMSTQTMVAMTETIGCTLAGGGGDEDPPSNPGTYAQNSWRIRDTFDIALRQVPRLPDRPGGPRGPGGPRDLAEPGGIPPTHLIPIPPAADLRPAGMVPQVFDRDRTKAEVFLWELRLYMMANQGVPGFELPIRQITIALTFIKGLKVNGWVEAMLQGLEQLDPIEDNVEYAYNNFLNPFKTQFADSIQ
jgi:hypothetical protein